MEGQKIGCDQTQHILHGIWSEPGLFFCHEHLQKTIFYFLHNLKTIYEYGNLWVYGKGWNRKTLFAPPSVWFSKMTSHLFIGLLGTGLSVYLIKSSTPPSECHLLLLNQNEPCLASPPHLSIDLKCLQTVRSTLIKHHTANNHPVTWQKKRK